MTETEKKALALLNEVCAEMGLEKVSSLELDIPGERALVRAIEQHEAFRQEVSDAVESRWMNILAMKCEDVFSRFIIAKADPLVGALIDCGLDPSEGWPDEIRAAIKKRGGKIVWGEG